MENIFANAISVIALVVSVVAIMQDRSGQKKSREFEIFKETYQTHLVQKLPAARAGVQVTQKGEITGVDQLTEELQAIRKDSLYFAYADKDFYEDLRQRLWRMEDYLVLIDEPLVEEKRIDYEHEMESMLISIYECITKRFLK